MKQATLDRRAQKWERQKYFLDKATALLVNPAGLLISGFVVTNVLQHLQIGETTAHEGTNQLLILPLLPPIWLQKEGAGEGVKVPLTALTDDQANILRGGLVAAFANTSGLLDALKGLLK